MSMKPLRTLVRDYSWIHLSIGLIGNTCFFVGSILFLSKSLQLAGTWLFIVGAGGMLIGALGRAVLEVEHAEHMKRHRDTASGEGSQRHE
jgi:hypothetical protein